jgi:hypothetical protein
MEIGYRKEGVLYTCYLDGWKLDNEDEDDFFFSFCTIEDEDEDRHPLPFFVAILSYWIC